MRKGGAYVVDKEGSEPKLVEQTKTRKDGEKMPEPKKSASKKAAKKTGVKS